MLSQWIAAMVCSAAAALAGCAGGSGASVRHQGRPAGVVAMPLHGVYRATIIPPFDFIGPISGRISAEVTHDGFVASTRPGVAWDMVGGVEGFLGSLFVPFIFPGGTIGTWKSTIPEDGKPGEGWFGVGGIKNAGVRTRINSPGEPVELLVRDGRRVGLLLLEPDSPDSPATRDYPGLAEDIASAVRKHLFDADAVESSAVRAYIRQVNANAKIARDDVEFIFGTVAAARNHIKFTMPVAFPKGDPDSRAAMKGWKLDEVVPVRTSFDRRTGIARLSADAFLSAADVDRAFAKILEWNPKGLIIDLRTTPGVSLASLRVLSWIADGPVNAGVWFGPQRRDDITAHPDAAPRFELSSTGSVDEIEAALDSEGAAAITIIPEPGGYRGPVAMLTSKRTSASAEPLVWAFKQTKRGQILGQNTSGKPYLSRPIDLRDRWVLWLATCDYRTPDGSAVPAAGIRPDIEVSSRENAVKEAERKLLSVAAPDSDGKETSSSLLGPFFKAANHTP